MSSTMREILFRGKRVDNGEWVNGFYVIIACENHYIFTGRIDLTQGSVGCEYCYARKQANRFKGCEKDKKAKISTKLNGIETGAVIELNAPLKKRQRNGKIVTAPYPFGFEPTLHRG